MWAKHWPNCNPNDGIITCLERSVRSCRLVVVSTITLYTLGKPQVSYFIQYRGQSRLIIASSARHVLATPHTQIIDIE